MSKRSLVVALPIFVAAGWHSLPHAAAQSIFICRDSAGRTLTSDRPMVECVGVVRELGPSGIVRREIAPPLTAEQLRQKELDDKARRVAEEALRQKNRRDSALLAAYQNEQEIEAARRRSLADADDSIKRSRVRLDELMKEKNALLQDAEAYKNKTMPPLFKRKLDDIQALIDDEEASMKLRLSDVERVNLRYDDAARRFRELDSSARGR